MWYYETKTGTFHTIDEDDSPFTPLKIHAKDIVTMGIDGGCIKYWRNDTSLGTAYEGKDFDDDHLRVFVYLANRSHKVEIMEGTT